jgi:mRNA interferase MazF
VNRGDVHWVRFARPDKKRPVVVLTRSRLIGHLGTVTVAALTTTVRDVPSQVRVGPEDGVPKPSAVNLHHVITLDRSELGPYITTLSAPVMASVDAALVFALGVGEGGESEL